MRRLLIATGIALAALGATASADTVTPDGPATLTNGYTGPDKPYAPLLVGWRVVVAPGGNAGVVRPRVVDRANPASVVLGDPVLLPAEPGTYTFPAPHRAAADVVGVDQETGGHAIVQTRPCAPERGRWGDPCQLWTVDAAPGGQTAGAHLNLEGVYEEDVDGDLLGDRTEDRTDLAVGAPVTSHAPDGRLRIDIPLTNKGPLTADGPVVAAVGGLPRMEWQDACTGRGSSPSSSNPRCATRSRCATARWPRSPGATRTVTLLATVPGRDTITLRAGARAPTCSPPTTGRPSPPSRCPAFTLAVERRQRLARAVTARVTAGLPGNARFTATFVLPAGRVVRLGADRQAARRGPADAHAAPSRRHLRELRRAVRWVGARHGQHPPHRRAPRGDREDDAQSVIARPSAAAR